MFSLSELQEIVTTFTGKTLITGDSTVPVILTYDQLKDIDEGDNETVYYIGDLQGVFGKTEYIEMSKRQNSTTNKPAFGYNGAMEADGSEQGGLTTMGLCHINQFVMFSCVDAIGSIGENNQITFRGYQITVE